MALWIGLMSGTSLDGVDGVLARIDERGMATLGHAHVAFPDTLRTTLLSLQTPGHDEIHREALASIELAQLYARCVEQVLSLAGVGAEAVTAIGCHGQTIRHRPDLGYTRQTNYPALLAELSKITVIADFRSRDIAAGGQGAPLVPAFHQHVFGAAHTRVVVNIGGISNISVLDANTRGHDTGPGNVLMDAWIQRHLNRHFDADGAWAATGRVDSDLLASLLAEPYFAQLAPKSTGRDLFRLSWLDARLSQHSGVTPQDVQATLCELTARTIAGDIVRAAPDCEAVFVCGGGARNRELMRRLQANLQQLSPACQVASTDLLGVAPEHVEALAFAWLAQRCAHAQTGNLPAVTGARGSRILGAIYPA